MTPGRVLLASISIGTVFFAAALVGAVREWPTQVVVVLVLIAAVFMGFAVLGTDWDKLSVGPDGLIAERAPDTITIGPDETTVYALRERIATMEADELRRSLNEALDELGAAQQAVQAARDDLAAEKEWAERQAANASDQYVQVYQALRARQDGRVDEEAERAIATRSTHFAHLANLFAPGVWPPPPKPDGPCSTER